MGHDAFHHGTSDHGNCPTIVFEPCSLLVRQNDARAFGAALILRTSFVLGRTGGTLKRLAALARVGLGGTVGNGRQGVSWIHERDMNRLFLSAITDTSMSGAYLATAPTPVSNAEFMRELRRALGDAIRSSGLRPDGSVCGAAPFANGSRAGAVWSLLRVSSASRGRVRIPVPGLAENTSSQIGVLVRAHVWSGAALSATLADNLQFVASMLSTVAALDEF